MHSGRNPEMQASSHSTSVGDARLPEQLRTPNLAAILHMHILTKLFLCVSKGITTYVQYIRGNGMEVTGKVGFLLALATHADQVIT